MNWREKLKQYQTKELTNDLKNRYQNLNGTKYFSLGIF